MGRRIQAAISGTAFLHAYPWEYMSSQKTLRAETIPSQRNKPGIILKGNASEKKLGPLEEPGDAESDARTPATVQKISILFSTPPRVVFFSRAPPFVKTLGIHVHPSLLRGSSFVKGHAAKHASSNSYNAFQPAASTTCPGGSAW